MAATGPTGSFPTVSTPPGGPFNQPANNTVGRSFTANVHQADDAAARPPQPPPVEQTVSEFVEAGHELTAAAKGPYTLNAEPGRYEVQGNDTGLAAQRRLQVEAGVYELNGGATLDSMTLDATAFLGEIGAATGRADGKGTAGGVGVALRSTTAAQDNVEIINRLEQQETALSEIAAEMVSIRVELTALAERDRFGPGGNGPPEELNIDEAIEDIEDGARSARLLRAALGDDLIYLSTDLVSALGKLCYNALKRAWTVVDTVRRWLLGKAERFADAFAVAAGTSFGKTAGPAALLVLLQQTGFQPLDFLQKLAELLRSLGILGN
jgi:hypothetical protein